MIIVNEASSVQEGEEIKLKDNTLRQMQQLMYYIWDTLPAPHMLSNFIALYMEII